jgi:hypothetical protein
MWSSPARFLAVDLHADQDTATSDFGGHRIGVGLTVGVDTDMGPTSVRRVVTHERGQPFGDRCWIAIDHCPAVPSPTL